MIEERYLNATKASNLRDDTQRLGQVDVIKASGMSARNIASTYLRLVSKPTQEDMTRLYASLLFFGDARQLESVPESIAIAVDWLLDPRCKVCQGAGTVIKKDKEHTCPKCKGAKLRKEPNHPTALEMIDYVQKCRADYGGRMLKLLR